jgi:hypothetical protein
VARNNSWSLLHLRIATHTPITIAAGLVVIHGSSAGRLAFLQQVRDLVDPPSATWRSKSARMEASLRRLEVCSSAAKLSMSVIPQSLVL